MGVPSLASGAALLRGTTIRSEDLVQCAVQRIEDPGGEGARAFIHFDRDRALRQARRSDRERRLGLSRSPVHGLPVSVKDLFDVVGERTTAASRILRDQEPADTDSEAVARLRAAGAVLIGRTNMTEFAYSALGLNPHFGTPLNPFDRKRGRIPGGSSSGAAVSVADGMACAALGTDTGGSVRIPAALCGLCGFKPTQGRVPLDGVLPLSGSLDSVGPLGWTVECCRTLFSVLSGEDAEDEVPLRSLRLGVPTRYVMDSLAPEVERSFEKSLRLLESKGAKIEFFPFSDLEQLPAHYRDGGLLAVEAYAWHRDHLARAAEKYDPRVSVRILAGSGKSEADYHELIRNRMEFMAACNALTRGFDALALPTVPIVAPCLAELERDEDYFRINSLALRNTSIANYLNRCAITIPNHSTGEAPTGFSLMGETGSDRRLLAIAASVESVIRPAER